MNLIRYGPRQLIVSSHDTNQFLHAIDLFFDEYKCIQNNVGNYRDLYYELTGEAESSSVIIHLSSEIKDLMRLNDFLYSIHIKINLEDLFVIFFNHQDVFPIVQTRLTPKLMIMKWIGSFYPYFEAVLEDLHGKIEDSEDFFDHYARGTLIAFTQEHLSQPVPFDRIEKHVIYSEMDTFHIMDQLQSNYLKYINIGVEKKDWYELEIKIYDAYEAYELHYERLIFILQKLNYGIILGESWGTDQANLFFKVGIYRIRFFTFLNPLEIKSCLLALEYINETTRIVDLDLFYKRKKIHWDELRSKTVRSKEDLIKKCQIQLKHQLTAADQLKLNQYNQKVLKSRK